MMITIFKEIKDKFENIWKEQESVKYGLADLKKNQIGLLEIKKCSDRLKMQRMLLAAYQTQLNKEIILEKEIILNVIKRQKRWKILK